MFFKQFYLSCLAHASYLVGDGGKAVVIDPQRDVDFYIEEAAKHQLVIKHIIETHLHADFVSGHLELAQKTGATIYLGREAHAQFKHTAIKEGDTIEVGSLQLKILETPGHTPEGISVLLTDSQNQLEPAKLFTGDTLFIGDVGRPDLVSSKGFSAKEMAAKMYDSLHHKILILPDSTEIYPAHGAGSACGKNISSEKSSTIGLQKKFNYALQPMTKEAFVQLMVGDLGEAPRYFSFDAEMNRKGALSLESLPHLKPLSPEEVATEINAGTYVLDVRSSALFCRAHLPSSIHISLTGSFAPWAGTVLQTEKPVILVVDNEGAAEKINNTKQIIETQMRLARVGIEKIKGYLQGGLPAWEKSGMKINRLSELNVHQLKEQRTKDKKLQIIDVRKPSEYETGHVPGALNMPLDELVLGKFEKKLAGLNTQDPTAIICASGYRSSIAASLLEKKNFQKLEQVVGGTTAWKNEGLELETL